MIPPAPPPGPAPRVLYISGPYSHPDPVHGIPKNILLASEAALAAGQGRGATEQGRQAASEGGGRP